MKVAAFDEERHPRCPRVPRELGLDGRLLAGRERDPAPDDRGLLPGDRIEGGAQVGLVVEVDARDDLHVGPPHGGRVEPAAETRLEHRHVDAFPHEVVKGKGRQGLEHGRIQPHDLGAERLHPVREIGLGNRQPADTDPLAKIDQVGRGVEADPAPA